MISLLDIFIYRKILICTQNYKVIFYVHPSVRGMSLVPIMVSNPVLVQHQVHSTVTANTVYTGMSYILK
jgi:hypothetical protein